MFSEGASDGEEQRMLQAKITQAKQTLDKLISKLCGREVDYATLSDYQEDDCLLVH